MPHRPLQEKMAALPTSASPSNSVLLSAISDPTTSLFCMSADIRLSFSGLQYWREQRMMGGLHKNPILISQVREKINYEWETNLSLLLAHPTWNTMNIINWRHCTRVPPVTN